MATNGNITAPGVSGYISTYGAITSTNGNISATGGNMYTGISVLSSALELHDRISYNAPSFSIYAEAQTLRFYNSNATILNDFLTFFPYFDGVNKNCFIRNPNGPLRIQNNVNDYTDSGLVFKADGRSCKIQGQGGCGFTFNMAIDEATIIPGYSTQYRPATIASDGLVDYYSNVGSVGNNVARIRADGQYLQISDIRLKENIIDVPNYLDDLCKLRVVQYSFKNSNLDKPDQIGFIAQEVEKVLPLVVTTDQTGYKMLTYSIVHTITVKAVQELAAKNKELESRILRLEKLLSAGL